MLANELMNQFQSLGSERMAVLGIGLPGLGKTEALSEVANMFEPEAMHLTYDNVELMIQTGDPSFSEKNKHTKDKKIRRELHNTASQYLEIGGSVIIDIGHTSSRDRRDNANFYRQKEMGVGAITAVYFMVKDVETAIERARSTGTRVGDGQLNFMLQSLQLVLPSCREGFDQVITVDASTPDFHILDVDTPF